MINVVKVFVNRSTQKYYCGVNVSWVNVYFSNGRDKSSRENTLNLKSPCNVHLTIARTKVILGRFTLRVWAQRRAHKGGKGSLCSLNIFGFKLFTNLPLDFKRSWMLHSVLDYRHVEQGNIQTNKYTYRKAITTRIGSTDDDSNCNIALKFIK